MPAVAETVAPEVARVVEAVRDAAASHTALRIVGRGSWLDAGRPVRADASLELSGLSGISDYVPGDLTLTVRAGTTLDEIDDATRAHGQWLTLDPYGGGTGTIGATIATGSAGPLAGAFGTPRDLVLGLTVVTGTGALIRPGARVVKNVAGFDLVRLNTGAWGTLGVIAEATLRLRARPAADRTLVIAVDDAPDGVAALGARLRALPAPPAAAELLHPALAKRLALGDSTQLAVRVVGSVELVKAQGDELRALGEAREVDGDLWSRLRAAEPAGAATFRLSWLPTRLGDCWRTATRVAATAPGALVEASMMRGIVRCTLPPDAPPERIAQALALTAPPEFGGTRVVERLPDPLWAMIPSPTADRLSLGVKRAYDPEGVLNPGIL